MISDTSVSVALAAYNGSPFIERQLTSVFDQTVQPDEVVVADDGSDDGTVPLVERMFRQVGTPRLVLIPPGPRRGVSSNFARAISACSSGLIALSDQDDEWVPDRLEQQRRAFDRNPHLTLAHSDADLIDGVGRSLGMTMFRSLGVGEREIGLVRDGRAFDVLIKRNIATGATIMFRRTLMGYAAPFPAAWVHDEWLAILAAAIGVVEISPARLIRYRQHATNQIGASDPSSWNRLRRMLVPRGNRNVRLASRARILADRLGLLGGVVLPGVLASAEGKAAYEARRAEWPSNRLCRAPHVFRELARSDYERFSSQGKLDAVRDLVQPG